MGVIAIDDTWLGDDCITKFARKKEIIDAIAYDAIAHTSTNIQKGNML